MIKMTHLVHHHLPELHIMHPDHFTGASDKQQRTRGIELDLSCRGPPELTEEITIVSLSSLGLTLPEQVILKQEAGLVSGLYCVEAVHLEEAVPAAGGQEAAICREGEVSDTSWMGDLLPPQLLGHLVTQAVILTDIRSIIIIMSSETLSL